MDNHATAQQLRDAAESRSPVLLKRALSAIYSDKELRETFLEATGLRSMRIRRLRIAIQKRTFDKALNAIARDIRTKFIRSQRDIISSVIPDSDADISPTFRHYLRSRLQAVVRTLDSQDKKSARSIRSAAVANSSDQALWKALQSLKNRDSLLAIFFENCDQKHPITKSDLTKLTETKTLAEFSGKLDAFPETTEISDIFRLSTQKRTTKKSPQAPNAMQVLKDGLRTVADYIDPPQKPARAKAKKHATPSLRKDNHAIQKPPSPIDPRTEQKDLCDLFARKKGIIILTPTEYSLKARELLALDPSCESNNTVFLSIVVSWLQDKGVEQIKEDAKKLAGETTGAQSSPQKLNWLERISKGEYTTLPQEQSQRDEILFLIVCSNDEQMDYALDQDNVPKNRRGRFHRPKTEHEGCTGVLIFEVAHT